MTELQTTLQVERGKEVGGPFLTPRPPATPFFARGSIRFAAVFIQFGLLVLLIRQFDLERGPFGDVMALALIGFAIHHYLPPRLRLPFFAVLSMASIPVAIGLRPGALVLATGLMLIGVCHLQWGFWLRVLALAAIVLVLLALRTTIFAPPVVVVGSMFMLRLIVYMYDLKKRAAPFGFFRATSYFFLLPNVCFPLFPLVDYKTFCATYYNDAEPRIYQTGLRWMLRGAVQLVLYRVLYQFVQVDPFQVSDLGGVARFVVTTYLLYLRVSGSFHLIVGLLHMFGFNLPETNHQYVLSSNFLDLWRRNNIYWKDFVVKLFFYPACFRLKRLGPTGALALATVYTFFATWVLHVYQAIWLRGTWAFTWQDAVFWWILGGLVLANTLFEAKRGRRRTLHQAPRTIRGELGHVLRTIGTFLVMCILWTVWSSNSADELVRLAGAARHVTLPGLAGILASLTVLGAAAILFGRSSAERTEASRGSRRGADTFAFWPSAGFVAAGALALLLFGESHRLPAAQDTAYAEVVQSLRSDRVNEIDFNARTRGYYEELDVTRQDVEVRRGLQPGNWWPAMKLHEETRDFLLYKPIPNVALQPRGKTVTYNSRGLRGPLYEAKKAPGVFRIALVGSSVEAGRGVSDDAAFPYLLERRLNREDVGERIRKFEVWNFAVEGYGALQKLLVVEQSALRFTPDLVIWVTYGPEMELACDQLAQALKAGYEAPVPFDAWLPDICHRAQVDASMPKSRIERLILPYSAEIVDRAFQRFAELCSAHHARGCLVYRPHPKEFVHIQSTNRLEVLRLGEKSGLPILDLSGCFASVADRDSLMVTPENSHDLPFVRREAGDHHPNAAGHRLLAERMYELLHEPKGRLLLQPRGTGQ